MSISTIKLALLFLISYITITAACRCIPNYPQAKFCGSDYVIKGTPVKMRVEDKDHVNVYTFKNLTFYKRNDTAELESNLDTINVYTDKEDAACAISFDLNVEYIITGIKRENGVYVEMCGFNKKWDSLPDAQIYGLANTYKLGCSCKFRADESGIMSYENECTVKDAYADCFYEYGACIKNKDEHCTTAPSYELMRCISLRFIERHPRNISAPGPFG